MIEKQDKKVLKKIHLQTKILTPVFFFLPNI